MKTIRITPARLFLAALTLAACMGLTIGTFALPSHSQSVTVQEDDPGWSCYTQGNLICGDPDGVRATQAWDAWDKFGGWKSLRVDPSKGHRVDYVGTAATAPKLADNEAAVPAIDGMWYVFRATQTP